MADMELTETRIAGETVYTGPAFAVEKDTVRLPDGKEGRRDLVRTNGGVVVLPLDENGAVTLVRQYRYAHRRVMTEAVAGKLEPGEEPFSAARRELREETGFTARRWTPLGKIATSPGFLTEQLYLYLARELTAGAQQLDEEEFLRCETCPLDELGRRIAAGAIEDAKTLAVYLRVRLLLEQEAERAGAPEHGGAGL